MKFAIPSLVGVALLATCLALPIDFGTGIDYGKDDFGYWNRDMDLGGHKLQLGMNWKKDGTIAVGAKVDSALNGYAMPITASAKSNIANWKDVTYQVGAKVDDRIGGVIQGDMTNGMKYLFNVRSPIDSIFNGVSVEGENFKPAAINTWLNVGGQVVQARVGLDENMIANDLTVDLGVN